MHLERQVQIERGSEREEEKWRERGGDTDRQTDKQIEIRGSRIRKQRRRQIEKRD